MTERLTDRELRDQEDLARMFGPESPVRRIVEELVQRRIVERAPMPQPLFRQVDGETHEEAYCRGFTDAWKTQARFRS